MSSIKRRGDSWYGRVEVGRDPVTGQRRQRAFSARTKKEVIDWIAELKTTVNKAQYVPPTKQTVAEWFDEWFDTVVKPHKAMRTVETYENVLENHLKPAMGAKKLQDLTPMDVTKYHASKLGGLTARTLSQHQAVLYRCLQDAMNSGLVQRNVAALAINKPKVPDKNKYLDAIENCWELEQATAFLAAARKAGPQAEAFYTTAIELGLRKGELAGIRWEDVDFDKRTIDIQQQLLKPGTSSIFGEPKNGSVRLLSASPHLMALLKAHKARQSELKLKNRGTYRDHGLVFAKEWENIASGRAKLGDPVQINNIGQREFATLIKNAGVPVIKFHGLRHTAATLALQGGIPPKVVQERLGHKKLQTTMDIYAHVLHSMHADAAEAIGGLLYGKLSTRVSTE